MRHPGAATAPRLVRAIKGGDFFLLKDRSDQHEEYGDMPKKELSHDGLWGSNLQYFIKQA
jgi:hypothetical protein